MLGYHALVATRADSGLSSWKAVDTPEAKDIEDITDVVTGEHLVRMDEIVALLNAGDLDAAKEMTMVMLAGFVPEVGTIDELHLRLALQALAVDDLTEASGHLERVRDGAFADAAHDALRAPNAGGMHDDDRATD